MGDNFARSCFGADLTGILSVSAAKENSGLHMFSDRQKDLHVKPLMKILPDDTHIGLMTEFEHLTMTKLSTCSTRSDTPYVFGTSNNFYHHSFIPRTSGINLT